MDNSQEQEKTQEYERLRKKEDGLWDLDVRSMGKLLKAEDREQAREALFEHVLIGVASWQLHAQSFRLENLPDAEEVEAAMNTVQKYKEYLDSITHLGDWAAIKKYYFYLNIDMWSPVDARIMGIDPNFKYKGEYIFSRDEKSIEFDTKEQTTAWDEFLKSKLDLIPDKTEPYAYPNIEALKTEIVST